MGRRVLTWVTHPRHVAAPGWVGRCGGSAMTNRRPTRRRHTGRRQAGPAVTLLAVALALGPVAASTSTPAADLGTPIPIKTTPAPVNETSPAADGRWFLWARGHANLGPDSLYLAQRGDSPRIRISASGTTVGEGGGISGTDGRLRPDLPDRPPCGALPVRPANQASREAARGRELPLHVEYSPSISGRFLVFQRNKRSGSTHVSRVVLYDLVTHRLRESGHVALVRAGRRGATVRHRPGQRQPRGVGTSAGSGESASPARSCSAAASSTTTSPRRTLAKVAASGRLR